MHSSPREAASCLLLRSVALYTAPMLSCDKLSSFTLAPRTFLFLCSAFSLAGLREVALGVRLNMLSRFRSPKQSSPTAGADEAGTTCSEAPTGPCCAGSPKLFCEGSGNSDTGTTSVGKGTGSEDTGTLVAEEEELAVCNI